MHPLTLRTHTPALVLTLLTLGSTASAESITVAASADTAIFSFNPGNNFGALADVPLGPINRDANAQGFFPQGRMLVRFDLAGKLPSSARVNSTRLEITVLRERSSGAALTIDAHRLLVPWSEGTGTGSSTGAAASAGESSWLNRIQGTAAWTQPGAAAGSDYSPSASSSAVIDNAGSYPFPSTTSLVADVQAWLDNPSLNHGWILLPRAPMQKGSAKRIVTREDASDWPALTIDYSVPPSAAPGFDSARLVDGQLELRFRGEPGNIYEIQFASSPEATTWQSLASFIAKLEPILAVATDAPTQVQRFYRIAITGQVD